MGTVSSFSSSLAVSPAYVLMLRKQLNPHGKDSQETNAINFCLVLASLGKFKKINGLSFTKKTHFIGAIWNKILIVIRKAESRAGEGPDKALCAQAGMFI